jgi:hypothetical protein
MKAHLKKRGTRSLLYKKKKTEVKRSEEGVGKGNG